MHQHKQSCAGHDTCSSECLAAKGDTVCGSDTIVSGPSSSNLDEVILRPALELFYLWATFAPLSRGTAACGYAALCAVLLAFGRKIASPHLLPPGKQLDWEAILAVDFEAFWAHTKGWFSLTAADEILAEIAHPWCENNDKSLKSAMVGHTAAGNVQANDLFSCVKTLRDMLDVMCLPYFE